MRLAEEEEQQLAVAAGVGSSSHKFHIRLLR